MEVRIGSTLVVLFVSMMLVGSLTSAIAFKLTPTSYQDGFNKGKKDARCDFIQCHGHGYDPPCPRGHTVVNCDGYRAGYNGAWDTMKEDSVAFDTNGNICNLGPNRDTCPGHTP